MTEKLKPCPFCGSETAPTIIQIGSALHVRCGLEFGGCASSGSAFYSAEAARTAWNKRADQAKELAALRAFAIDAMDLSLGSDVHHVAIKHGLLQIETRTEPCGKECACMVFYGPINMAHGVVCYRKTALLTGAEQ